MAANRYPMYVKSVTGKGTTWTNSDAASTKKVISPTIGTDGARIHSISVASSDTVDRVFNLYLNDGSTDFLVGSFTAALGAGNTPAVAVISLTSFLTQLPWLSSDGAILLPTGWSLKAENATQVTAAKTVTFLSVGGDY